MRVAMDPDLDLALRCAWLSLVGGYTHEEIAARVATSRVKVTRLIQTAQRAGLVKVSIEGAPANCAALEEALVARYGLAHCSVAPDLGEEGLPLSALGTLGAHVIRAAIERDGIDVIGDDALRRHLRLANGAGGTGYCLAAPFVCISALDHKAAGALRATLPCISNQMVSSAIS